jgi:hypothetical protein
MLTKSQTDYSTNYLPVGWNKSTLSQFREVQAIKNYPKWSST